MAKRSIRISQHSALSAVLKQPMAAMLGVFVLPVLHILIKMRWIETKDFAKAITVRSVERPDADLRQALDIAKSVWLGARIWHLHHSSCIARSVLIWGLCTRRGFPASVWIGHKSTKHEANKAGDSQFHAWVELCGTAIQESDDLTVQWTSFDRPYLSPKDAFRN